MMELTPEQARSVVFCDSAYWSEIDGTRQTIGTTRWSIAYEGIFQHLPTGNHYRFVWSQGATENQEESPFEYDEGPVRPRLVVEKRVTTRTWVDAE